MRFAEQELRTYFITFSTARRRRIFQVEANAPLMMGTIESYRNRGRFLLHAFVVMHDHVHVLITPAPDVSLEKAIQFSGGFSFRRKSRLPVWERGHFDKRVADKASYDACVTYIHCNPVQARMVSNEMDYVFSSAACPLNTDPMPNWFR